MNVAEWVAIGGIAVTVVGWFIRLERRLGAHLTRAEHEAICSKRDSEMKGDLDHFRDDMGRRHNENLGTLGRIEALIERNHQDSVDGRHDVRNQILALVEKVGTIQGRLGLDEFRKRDER